MQSVTIDQVAELYRAAFAQVHDPLDWKAPIDCVVPYELANLYMQAIEFMTGTRPTGNRISTCAVNDGYRLVSPGYRNGPCGG